MSNYEFWDELGKIFSAVVAYQEKTIEFNKRFINPWIRLGNVFDKQDRNKEAVSAYKKAIEIDPNNAQNWYELGNIYFRMESHDEAIDAFNRAIELDPEFGWPYSNLALTLVTQGKHVQAIPLYRKSIELLPEDKDKAVAWNRLGNVYRKLNEYELAVEAFQKADELDQENAGFRDNLDEVSEGPSVVEASSAENGGEATEVNVSPIELILAEGQAEETASRDSEQSAQSAGASMSEIPTVPVKAEEKVETANEPLPEPATQAEPTASDSGPVATAQEAAPTATEAVSKAPVAEAEEPVSEEASAPTPVEANNDAAPVAKELQEPVAENAPEATDDSTSEPVAVIQTDKEAEPNAETSVEVMAEATEETEPSQEETAPGEETVTVIVQSTVETYTETMNVAESPSETADASDAPAATEEAVEEPIAESVEEPVAEKSEQNGEPASVPEAVESQNAVEANSEESADATAAESQVQNEAEESVAEPAAVAEENVEASTEEEVETPEHAAYEEYLKDSNESLNIFAVEEKEIAETAEQAASQEPVAKIDPSGELQIEMDTKNAHVWNELGNVYFNSGAFDDAVIAYSKAIELDRWFAWPYSNLALTYVQKGRFVEAILLYQRSIELFAGDKDKAISWNRLGNVYRRLNDYENAIASYQRADELDPDNTTLSMQSRFSLLGSYAMEQKPSYVS